MPTIFDTLQVGATGLAAQQFGLQTVSHNVANVGTEGYHRRDLMLGPIQPLFGVEVLGVRRAVDQQLTRQLREQTGFFAYAEARQPFLENIESILGRLDDSGIGAALDQLFVAFQDLAAAPSDLAVRQTVLGRGAALATTIRRAASDLQATRTDANQRLISTLPEVNRLLQEVATLNRDILLAESGGGDSGDLRDRRGLALTQLSDLVGAKTLDDGSRGVIVLIGGMRVVQDTFAETLAADIDPTTGMAQIRLQDPPQTDLTTQLGGRMGAYVNIRDQIATARLASLDQFAFDIATAINTQHNLGYGLDGVGSRDFFTPTALAGAAAALTLSSDIATDPNALAAALDPLALPGDGRNALALGSIADLNVALGGTTTLSQSLGNLLADLGQATRSAALDTTREQDRMATLESMREQVSGVSLDEQMILLSKFQRAYEASTRVVSTISEAIERLINL